MSAAAAAEPSLPEWAHWNSSRPYTVGVEEEVMLLDPADWGLAHVGEQVLSRLPAELAAHTAAETHQATLELATSPHGHPSAAAAEAAALRVALAEALAAHGLHAACAGTHPLALWTDSRVSSSARYQLVHQSMRELARREPTFALHVHVGVADAEDAIRLQNRMRAYLPLLLALSANSPFWQARATGLASARTPIFQAFPRVGVPRPYENYADYVGAVDQLLRCGAFPASTFLWWDVRPQPALGTIEVRVMDAQTTAAETGALTALVQVIAHLELECGYVDPRLIDAQEVIEENRFLAARDGMSAELIDPVADRRRPAAEMLHALLEVGREHAEELGCEAALELIPEMARENGSSRQLRLAAEHSLQAMVRILAGRFDEPLAPG